MAEPQAMICNRCQKAMVPSRTAFSYLEHTFYADIPRCPDCGLVFIPESLAKGRIQDVEMQLEDK